MKAQQARDGLAAAGYSRAAFNALHEAERELAASKGEEWAEPVDLAVVWDGGAPLPHVISSGRRTILICRAADRDPDWDGTRVRLVSPTDTEPVGHLEFTFEGCSATRFGGPNDEVLHGHPLSSRGLDGYGVHLVHNSRWIAEEEAINSVHPPARGRVVRAHQPLLLRLPRRDVRGPGTIGLRRRGTGHDVGATHERSLTDHPRLRARAEEASVLEESPLCAIASG